MLCLLCCVCVEEEILYFLKNLTTEKDRIIFDHFFSNPFLLFAFVLFFSTFTKCDTRSNKKKIFSLDCVRSGFLLKAKLNKHKEEADDLSTPCLSFF